MTQNNDIYRQQFERSKESQLILTAGKITQCNQSAIELFGFNSEADILGMEPAQLSPEFQPDGNSSVIEATKKIAIALKTGSNRFEWTHKRKNDEEFPVEVLLTTIDNTPGSEIIHASMHDISTQKRISKALLESEDRFKQLSNLSFEGIIIHESGIILDVNLAIERVSGYNREEIIGHNMLTMFVPERYKALVYENIVKNHTSPYHIEVLNKKGNLIPVEVESRNITIGSKTVRVTAVRDLSERERHQLELEKSQEKYKKAYELFRLMADTTPDMIWAKDMQGNFTFVNKAICEKLINAKNIEEPIGKHISFFIKREQASHPDNKEWFTFGESCYHSDEITIKNKKTSHFTEHGNVFGKYLSLDIYKAPLFNDKGEMIGTVGSARDITKQQEAERQLKLSEERYRMLFEYSPDSIIIHDGKTILDVNTSTIKISGLKSKDELIGKSISLMVHPDDLPKAKNRMNQMLKGLKKIENEEFRIITPTGKELTVLATPAPIIFKNKPAFMVTYHDITNRKKTERDLAEKEKQFHTVVESANDAIYLIDFYTTKIILANKQASIQTGYSNKELLNRTILDINPRLCDAKYRKKIKNKILTQKSISLEIDNMHKNGNTFPAEVTISLIYFNGRKTILGFVKDITERKETENALKTSEEKFKKAFLTSPDSISISRIDTGEYIAVNKSFTDILGYQEKEVIGKTSLSLNIWKNRATRDKFIKRLVSGGVVKNMAIDFITKSGEIRHTLLSASIINLSEKPHILSIARDISDRRKAEEKLKMLNEELKKQNEEYEILNNNLKKSMDRIRIINRELEDAKHKAEESDRLKSAFLANMSHEIRTPMNGILGFSNLLKDTNNTPQERLTYLNVIEQSGNKLLSLINNLIDISRIELGQMGVNKSACNVTKQLKDIHLFFSQEAQQKNIKLDYQEPPDNKQILLQTDCEKFNAIISNLIKNALKYTKEGRILYGFVKEGKNLKFFVKDTGIGIAKDRQNAIFDRFVQADIEDRNVYEGAGLGLSIAKAYVEMLGGKIWLESEEGKGSAFFFTIPDNSPSKKTPSAVHQNDPPATKKNTPKLNILIVEDDTFSNQLLTLMLNKVAKKLFHASTGQEAIEIFKNHPEIDLIMMDIKMKEMDGYQTTKEIRKISNQVVIIAQTAYAMVGDKEKALAAGCNDYLTKPVMLKDILEKINTLFPG